MAEKVFKKVTVTGCSDTSYEAAIEAAVRKASSSLRGLAWFEVRELRGGLNEGKVEWQATINVAFKVET